MKKINFTSGEILAKIEKNDYKRQIAYKAVLIISLCITISSWVAIFTIFPVLYQFINISNNQYNHVLEFCEDTVTTVYHDSVDLYQLYKQHNNEVKFIKFNDTKEVFKRETEECSCEALPGPPGEPGRSGLKGAPGKDGTQGKPAILPCQPPPDYKKWCPESCPSGEQGHPGPRGHMGERGPKGNPGLNGKNGKDGETGPRGPPGKPGKPGFDGPDGDPGKDTIPSPFEPGPPGDPGPQGPSGPPGPRGMPGIEGPQGEPGRKGSGGRHGVPGQQGPPGLQGMMGDPGKPGQPGVCPTYCSTDGGVFFVEPPDWFFDEQNR